MIKIFFIKLRKFSLFFLALILSVFLFKNFVFGSDNDVVITEICPTGCAESGFQWIEIYNKGDESMDLTGWKFWEADTNHSLNISEKSLFQTFILAPKGYAVITQNDLNFFERYPNFSSLILDSSWTTLNKGGEEIGLKKDDSFIENFVYKAIQNNHSLERMDVFQPINNIDNWQEHPDNNSVGQKNYWSLDNNDIQNQKPVAKIVTSGNIFQKSKAVDFDGSTSSDSDGQIVEYNWLFDNILLSTSSFFSYIFSDIGNFSLELKVIDDKNDFASDIFNFSIVENFESTTTTTNTIPNYEIVINEFVSDPVAGENEWVEIYNNSTSTIDLKDWEVHEGDKSSSSTKKILVLDNILETKSFLRVNILSSKLNNDGDGIFLYDNSGNLIDTVRFGDWIDFFDEDISDNAPAHSDPYSVARIVDGQNTGNNKNDFSITTEPTPGEVNIIKNIPVSSSGGGSSSSSEVTTKNYNARDLVINELVSDPSDGEKEFVEIYNNTSEIIDLNDWSLEDGSETITILTGTILPKGFFVIEEPKGSLNNAGDILLLLDPSKKEIDKVTYGNWDDGNTYDNAAVASDPYSLIRKTDGQDADNDYYDFIITDTITRGQKNVLSLKAEDLEKQEIFSLQTNIVLNEIYPNPPGSDSDDEFIEIWNKGTETIDLKDWQLSDSSKKKYTIKQGVLKANEFIVFKRTMTQIALNNTGGDEVKLFSPNGAIVNSVSYPGSASDSFSYVRQDDATWVWSSKITAGSKNIVEGKSAAPIIALDVDTEVAVNEWVKFDASDTVSPEGKDLKFHWDFADGTDEDGASVEHKFLQQGVYTVSLTVSDGSNESKKDVVLSVKLSQDFVGGYAGTSDISVLYISEILPNPVGSDTTEFIEIHNPTEEDVDISGLKIDDEEGGSKAYTVGANTLIKAKEYKVFGRQDTKLALNNTSDSVRLLYPDGTIIMEVRFDDVIEGASYVRNSEGNWIWNKIISPGEVNFVEEITEVKSVKIVKSKSNSVKAVINTSLEKIRDEDLGDMISVTGTVAVEPGIMGTQIFYIVSENAGVQIYMFSKDFPDLKRGDKIEVMGEITETSGETRIKLKEKNDIKKLGHSELPIGRVLELEDVGEQYEGSLILVSGEITEIKSSYMYVDDGTEEIKVYFKRGAGIKKDIFEEGNLVSITGLLHQTKTEYQLLPRDQNDIIKTGVSEDLVTKKEKAKEQDNADIVEKYLTATAGGFTAILFGLFLKSNGENIFSKIKKLIKKFISK
ncbi:MAG: lamin tail domain-containing protein [Candidatus Magasanikbacteria bacterium]